LIRETTPQLKTNEKTTVTNSHDIVTDFVGDIKFNYPAGSAF
jgi:hypothetical protein